MTAAPASTFAERLAARRADAPAHVPHVVDGEESYEGPLLRREDPSNPSVIVSECHDAPAELVQRAIEAARRAQREWQRVPLAERIAHVRRAIPFIEDNIEDWAERVALEVGKPYAAARAEGAEVLDLLRFSTEYAAAPGAFEDERLPDPTGVPSDSVLRPYGVFGAITPFNYPIVQAAGPAIGALLAGNGVVVKTSHHGPWSGLAVAEFCAAMDLPRGLVNVIHGADDPGRVLVDSDIDGICFTGSVAVGRSIMQTFAAGPYARPVIAEMGGKNPVIVTDSADLEQAADGIVFSAFDLSGQKCSALSRVLVSKSVHDRLVELVTDRLAAIRTADPAAADSFAGPVVTREAVERHERLVAAASSEGFSTAQGQAQDGGGYFVPATVVSGVPAEHPLATDEHFLPLLTISPVAGFDDALAAANASSMGLTAGIYTGSRTEAETFLAEMEAGCVNVNVPGHATTGWWPGPQTFGGWKASGSTGKHTLGKWYVSLFARQQARKISPELESLLTY